MSARRSLAELERLAREARDERTGKQNYIVEFNKAQRDFGREASPDFLLALAERTKRAEAALRRIMMDEQTYSCIGEARDALAETERGWEE